MNSALLASAPQHGTLVHALSIQDVTRWATFYRAPSELETLTATLWLTRKTVMSGEPLTLVRIDGTARKATAYSRPDLVPRVPQVWDMDTGPDWDDE